ncbi:AMP-binding protein [Alisedimentitalea sp. MJ-SS2]|uniref:AMP-binding protein n=1 Tax=Aliisedimentitalea sp. MJ-SS2 TaxID=3049795 RepID=UPI0029103266|nr:AMP-binding protein [Alisedimentitalea sp. MJ-SS2]MDU8926005.1 AMP-binding protein [Alisedimentitalea sp. MJ-SS2]
MTIITSPYEDVELREMSVTSRVFEGLGGDPDRVVLTEGTTGRQITTDDFISTVKSLAGGLNARGTGKGTMVALMAPNLPEYAVVFHGVAWAGGTVTLVNPTYTAQELRHQLNDSGATLLVTIPQFLDMAREAAEGTSVQEVVVIGEAPDTMSLADLMGDPQEDQTPVDLHDHVVALPYSSGTTGLPKGVMLTHWNLVANIDQTLSTFEVVPGEATVAFLPFFHIYGLQCLMSMVLAAGGALITMPRFDLELFLRLSSEYGTRRMYVVPPVMIALAKHPMVEAYDLSCVEQVNSGAAPLGGDVTTAVSSRLGCVAGQGYGMTELSPVSHSSHKDNIKQGSSGVTVCNTECRVVDPGSGQDVEPGDEGELWVRGPQVMKGYWNNPEATAETLDSDGWLHTGDIVRFDEDGHMFVTDRLKELIKYKGFQVAPAEVEAALITHPNVADVGVIGVPDDEAGEIPMGFIVPVSGGEVPTLEDLQAHLEGQLSHYKQLRRLEIVDEVPKAASGKILRRVLREQAASR